MIDEKKIGEAADEYAQNECGYSYNVNKSISFEDGANWAINEFLKGLWHDAREEPERGKILLIKHHQLGVRDPRYLVLNEGANGDWSDTVADYLITRWLYIEDLMKGGK